MTLHLKSEVGRSPFPSRYIDIINQYDIPRSTNLFCKIMQASAKPCRVSFLFLSCFFFLFTPTEFTVAELYDDMPSTDLKIIILRSSGL